MHHFAKVAKKVNLESSDPLPNLRRRSINFKESCDSWLKKMTHVEFLEKFNFLICLASFYGKL